MDQLTESRKLYPCKYAFLNLLPLDLDAVRARIASCR